MHGVVYWGSPFLTARFAFWVWLAIYILVPVGVGLTWLWQRQVPGVEPARKNPLPAWFRALLAAQALFFAVFGLALFLFPSAAIPSWPWTLTPLTSAAVGAWLIGIAATLAWALWENDGQRLRGTMITYGLLGVLLLIGLARYGGEIDWNRAIAWLYLAFLVSVLVMGGTGALLARRASS